MAAGFSYLQYLLGSSATNFTTGPHSSQNDLESLEQKIGPYAVYQPISSFYHVTKPLPKASIIYTNKLRGSVAKMTKSPSTLSPIHGRLSGVFFSCNLSKRGYGLPDSSPFGSERIKMPITEFASSRMHLFYNSHHNTTTKIYYVILVLVKESDSKYKFCKDHMIELDMESNRFLRLNFQRNKFEYCDPIGFNLWVELFVVGDVPLTDINHSWDKVTERGRNQSRPRSLRRHHHSASDYLYRHGMGFDSDDDDSDDDLDDDLFKYGLYDYDY